MMGPGQGAGSLEKISTVEGTAVRSRFMIPAQRFGAAIESQVDRPRAHWVHLVPILGRVSVPAATVSTRLWKQGTICVPALRRCIAKRWEAVQLTTKPSVQYTTIRHEVLDGLSRAWQGRPSLPAHTGNWPRRHGGSGPWPRASMRPLELTTRASNKGLQEGASIGAVTCHGRRWLCAVSLGPTIEARAGMLFAAMADQKLCYCTVRTEHEYRRICASIITLVVVVVVPTRRDAG